LFLEDFLQDRNLQDKDLVFYTKKLRSIFSNYHTLTYSLNNTTWEKDRESTKKIARNREFHGIGQEVDKSLKNQIRPASLS
jgi:hypothetical protein